MNEEKKTLQSKNGTFYKVLDKVLVHIEVVEPQPHRPKLQLSLLLK